jgi:hypothetical protein
MAGSARVYIASGIAVLVAVRPRDSIPGRVTWVLWWAN